MTETEKIKIFDNDIFINNQLINIENSESFIGKPHYGYGLIKLFNDFYNCVEQKRKFQIDGTEGSKALRLVLAMYRSKGQTISIQ